MYVLPLYTHTSVTVVRRRKVLFSKVRMHHHIVFTSSHCIYIITLYLHHHIVFTLSQCIYIITLYLHHHIVFTSSHCIYIITLYLHHHIVFISSHCVYIITLYLRLYVFGNIAINYSNSNRNEGRKWLHSTHFIYSYMALDIL